MKGETKGADTKLCKTSALVTGADPFYGAIVNCQC